MAAVNIDIIILSFAKDENTTALTLQTIDTLVQSEDPDKVKFNVVIIESNKALKPHQFEHTQTLYPEEKFGFNKYLNIGINATSNKYICLCNNDLVFHPGWAGAFLDYIKELNTDDFVLSPFCELSHPHFSDLPKPVEGYWGYFAGHCFFTTRSALKKIGPLDEKINFWYADNDFLNILQREHIPHYFVRKSWVTHLKSQIASNFNRLQRLRYNSYPRIYFRYKWEDHSRLLYLWRSGIYLSKYVVASAMSLFTKE